MRQPLSVASKEELLAGLHAELAVRMLRAGANQS